jgi:carbon-monoxide dehydrogenase medium subunit
MNFRLSQPPHLVDIGRLQDLAYVRLDDGHLAVGAGTRQSELERSDVATARTPLLVEAVRLVAHPPIRHRGTVGGSIAHADPAAELPTVALALDAEVVATSRRGARSIPARDFFEAAFTTSLQPDELVTEIRFPTWPEGSGYAFEEFTRTHGNFAVVGVGALVHLDGDVIDRAAVALCGVGGAPARAAGTEAALVGQRPTADTLDRAADAAADGLAPSSDVHGSAAFRRRLTRFYTRKALEAALARRGGGA